MSDQIASREFIGDLKGSVFADDSTLLVDSVNGTIPYTVLTGAPSALSEFSNDLDYAGIIGITIQTNGLPVNTFLTGDLNAQNYNISNANLVNATGDLRGSLFADNSTLLVDGINGVIFAENLVGIFTGNVIGNTSGYHTGDVTGSVFADNSTLLVDAVNGTIPGYISIQQLKILASSSATYGDFQTAIAAL
jgi:inosine/xanthosine triphosphate pyrophosphatase family protein